MISTIDSENAFDKIQPCFLRNALYRIEIKGTCIIIVKALHNNLIANIILNREKNQGILTNISGLSQGCPLFPPLFNTVLEVLPR